jgi:acetyl-CoA C-acetyltransferase
MVDAVIVSTARTPIGKAYRGALNDTTGATLGGHAIAHALSRSGVNAAEIEDVIMGCAMQQGTTSMNLARRAALTAGLPVTVAGATIDRQCASGLNAIAIVANAVRNDGMPVGIAGGLESISLVQNEKMNNYKLIDEKLMGIKPEVYMPMIDTAEVVAKRYGISREAQDAYALESQRRVAAAQAAGRFDAEIAPIDTVMAVVDKETKAVSHKQVTLSKDEGPRSDTTAEGPRQRSSQFKGEGATSSPRAMPASSPTASAASVMMSEQGGREAVASTPMGIFRGFNVAGCEPDEMGIGPVFASPAAARTPWAQDRRHRTVGTERGLRRAGDLLPRPARHRPGQSLMSTAARSRSAIPTA